MGKISNTEAELKKALLIKKKRIFRVITLPVAAKGVFFFLCEYRTYKQI